MIALKLEKRWNRVSICRTPERQKGEPSNSSKVLRMLHRLFIAACLFSLPILCWPDPAHGPKSSGFTLRPLCPVSHCPIEDKGELLALQPEKGRILTILFFKTNWASYEEVCFLLLECRKQRLGRIVTISRCSTFTRPPPKKVDVFILMVYCPGFSPPNTSLVNRCECRTTMNWHFC